MSNTKETKRILDHIKSLEGSDRNMANLVKMYIGQKVAILCGRYQYRGILVDVIADIAILSNTRSVEISGPSRQEKPEREDLVDTPMFIHANSIEIIYRPNWSDAPLTDEEETFELLKRKKNMYEIKIEIHPKFWDAWEKDKKNDKIPFLISRVASICCNNPDPYKQKQGYEWALDRSNDWKAERSSEDPNVLVVAYRYGDGHADYMQTLQEFLQCYNVIGKEEKGSVKDKDAELQYYYLVPEGPAECTVMFVTPAQYFKDEGYQADWTDDVVFEVLKGFDCTELQEGIIEFSSNVDIDRLRQFLNSCEEFEENEEFSAFIKPFASDLFE